MVTAKGQAKSVSMEEIASEAARDYDAIFGASEGTPHDPKPINAYWYCRFCGDSEPAEEPYEVGDTEPCSTCGEGVSEVMTIKAAAKCAQEIALGVRKPERAYK